MDEQRISNDLSGAAPGFAGRLARDLLRRLIRVAGNTPAPFA
ncbi:MULTISPECIES: hypothetical protein [Amycolatopsis]|nr:MULTISPECIES: hypothetical protein [Amycolatopsis]